MSIDQGLNYFLAAINYKIPDALNFYTKFLQSGMFTDNFPLNVLCLNHPVMEQYTRRRESWKWAADRGEWSRFVRVGSRRHSQRCLSSPGVEIWPLCCDAVAHPQQFKPCPHGLPRSHLCLLPYQISKLLPLVPLLRQLPLGRTQHSVQQQLKASECSGVNLRTY